MPHDRNGRLLEIGDYVKVKPYNASSVPVIGRITRLIVNESRTCDASVAFITPFEGVRTDYCGTVEMDLVLKADGSDPSPVAAG